MKNYKTPLTEKLETLASEGYQDQFIFSDNKLKNNQSGQIYGPEDLEIIKMFRFEGESNPADMSILYVLESKKGEKGTLVNAYGTYGDHELDEFIKKLGRRKI
ncbi:MAG: hypothetical protein ACNS62_16305 [Candidatus Cyclobacteriaceae bacterium M3_2C_046]